MTLGEYFFQYVKYKMDIAMVNIVSENDAIEYEKH